MFFINNVLFEEHSDLEGHLAVIIGITLLINCFTGKTHKCFETKKQHQQQIN